MPSKLQSCTTLLLSLFVLSSISTNVASGLLFPTTGSDNLCFITDPSLYGSVPLRGSGKVGESGLSQTSWTGGTSLCLKSVAGSGASVAIALSLNRNVENVFLDDDSEYSVGNIGNISSQQFPTTGGIAVYLIGSGFGVFDLSPSSKFGVGNLRSRAPMLLHSFVGGTISPRTTWKSDSSIVFSTAIGNGRGLWIAHGETRAQMLVLQIGQTTTSAISMFTFASPRVLPINQTKISTGLMVCIIGNNFAMWNNRPMVSFVAGSKAYISNWMSDSSILAKIIASPFIGSTQVIITVASQIGTHPEPWNVSMSLLLSAAIVPSTGSTLSQLSGQGFGLHQNSAQSKMQQTVSQFTRWLSDSDIHIKLFALKEQGTSLILTVNRYTGLSQANLTSPVHSVQYLGTAGIPASGSVFMSLNLFSGGIFDISFRCKLEAASRSSMSASIWKSDSSIVTKFNAGLLKGFGISVTLKQFSALATGISALIFTSVSNSSTRLCVPLTGSQSQFFSGSGLSIDDASARARLAHTGCQRSAWKSDSSLICKSSDVSGNVRGWLAVFFSVPFSGVASANSSDAIRVLSNADMIAKTSFVQSTTGSQLISINLNSYGVTDMSISFRTSNSESRGSIWLSHSSVVLKISAGSGANHNMRISVPNLACVQNVSAILMSYKSPSLSTNTTAQINFISTGSGMIQMTGINFGLDGQSLASRLRASSSSSMELTKWNADSAANCKLPSFSVLNISVLMSSKYLLSMPIPIVFGSANTSMAYVMLNVSNSAHTGGQFFHLTSSSFGTKSVTLKIRMAVSSSHSSHWASDTSAICKNAPRSPSTKTEVVVSMNQQLSVRGTIFVDAAELILTSPGISTIPSSAVAMITLFGAVSPLNLSPKLKISPSDCPASIWTSSSSLICKTPSGIVSTWQIVVTELLLSGSFSVGNVNWSSIPPQSNVSLIATGSQLIRTFGRYGNFDSSVKSKVGASTCDRSIWVSDSLLICKYVSGQGLLETFRISVGKNNRVVNFVSSGYTFSLPSVLLFNISGSQNNASTGSVIRQLVSAVGLGTFSYSARFRRQLSGAETTNWLSDSNLHVKLSSGITLNRKVTLTIARQASDSLTPILSQTFSQLFVEMALQPATGSLFVEIFGQSLFICPGSIGVRLGASASVVSNWISSSSILAKSLPGAGFSTTISMSSNSFVDAEVVYLSYQRPEVIINSGSKLSSGSTSVSVFGGAFGSFGLTCTMRIVKSLSQSTRWISSSALRGLSMSGLGLIPTVVVSYRQFYVNATTNLSF